MKIKTLFIITCFTITSCTPLPKMGEVIKICKTCNNEEGSVIYRGKYYPAHKTSTGYYFKIRNKKIRLHNKPQVKK